MKKILPPPLRLGVNSNKGFTLLEVLLVVALISILAGIVILAINPNKQLGDTRNAQRRVDVNTILNATYQYIIDNNGSIGVGTTAATEICKTGGTCTSLTDLSFLTLNEKYLVSMPIDPSGGCNANGVCYKFTKDFNNRITISAPGAENNATISVTR